jgi:hypothetical protein
MKRRILLCVFALASALLLILRPVFAEVKAKGGADIEIKHEYWKNIYDMDSEALDNRNLFQAVTSPWGQLDFTEDFSLYAKLVNQLTGYSYFAPASTKPTGREDKEYHFDVEEVAISNLYLDAKNLLGLPLDLRLGRQDFVFQYGEGFVIFDGTPCDGKRTAYFNAAKITFRADEGNSLDFIYINDPRDDIYLPVMNEDKAPQALTVTDEEGYVLYWKNKSLADLALEGYYIYKIEDSDGGGGLQAQNSKLNTLGSFARYTLSVWTLRGQFAYQLGDYGVQDREGFGGYAYLDRDFKSLPWSPKASLGFTYLSGDKQDTGKVEGWNPLFSRYGWFTELYPSSLASDTGLPAYWTNLQLYRIGAVLKPSQKITIYLWQNFLRANEQVTASAVCSGAGRNRGHLSQAKIEYMVNKNATASFEAEYFIPGNFYKGEDAAIFLRTDLTLRF